MPLYAPPTQDFLQKTLDAQLLTGVTASATLNNTTGLANLPGVMIIDRINTNNVETPSAREVIAYSGTSGATVTTLTRGLAGTTDQDHAVSAIVEFTPDVIWADSIYDALANLVNTTTLAIDSTKITAGVSAASDTAAGKVELATTAETTTGTDATRAVTPDGLHDMTSLSGAAWFLDEDTMTSNSDTKVPSQQSTKAYVDTQIAGISSNTDGWITSSDTWVYASASTFTIAGVDRTTTFTKGTRLKFTNSGTKYAVVVSSSFSTNTTVTIAVNTDYTIANAAISSPYYSYAASPQGYPTWYTFATTYAGFSANPTQVTRFSILGSQCTVLFGAHNEGTSNATTLTMTVPVASIASGPPIMVTGRAVDNGGENIGMASLPANTTTLTCSKTTNGSAWTSSGSKAWQGVVSYQF